MPSLISSVLSGRKALLMRRKGRFSRRPGVILQGPGPCYKVRPLVASGANACTPSEQTVPGRGGAEPYLVTAFGYALLKPPALAAATCDEASAYEE